MISVSCIIPARNEARRIGSVLDAVTGHPLLSEIIVVDDGSTDGTAKLAQRQGITVIRLPENRGKSRAVAEGIAAAAGTHLLLLDADLIGLTADDITALIQPVRRQQSDVTISLRRNSPLIWRIIGLDYISGERVFARALVAPYLDELRSLPHFGLEVWLNRLWIDKNVRIRVVKWRSVISPYKAAKMGWLRGLRADAAMMRDIFRTISLRECLRQIRALRRKCRH
ncbi:MULTISPECIES: glycosyltransferase family 2 protein [unclassified Brenneria]|uniref:glycosyltransferase family 2 protein n=1 Tax=unclassified Brenneria TaxID=2634434 RepID=UPI001554CB0B|nr:glycosyltransferase [Brenneria sp. hezel4-2-4]MEE3650339.1 glycosyltransferase [Brenneria sp. HEZEL_4_2_4]NPD00295.1 glycosyltransferase [Brenneria sp. hezel4-2-4]